MDYHELAKNLDQITNEALMNNDLEEMRLFEDLLAEFMGDLDKQSVVLMGLPAAGKSTFINGGQIGQYVPGFKGYKVVNSDAQLARTQYKAAEMDFKRLNRVKSQEEWDKLMDDMRYKDNAGNWRMLPIDWEEFKSIKNFAKYYKRTYKDYYSTYFDMRQIAKWFDAKLFDDKIKKTANILVIDTVAAKPDKLFDRLQKAKEVGFQNSIFYLEINPELSIVRDKYRGETEGRTVGEKVIMDYAKKMGQAFRTYRSECGKKDGIVDRLYHFKWNPQGDSPIKGAWSLEKKYKCDIQRQLANIKSRTMAQGEETECGCGR